MAVDYADVFKAAVGLSCEDRFASFEAGVDGRRIVPAAPLDVKLRRFCGRCRRIGRSHRIRAHRLALARPAGRLSARAPFLEPARLPPGIRALPTSSSIQSCSSFSASRSAICAFDPPPDPSAQPVVVGHFVRRVQLKRTARALGLFVFFGLAGNNERLQVWGQILHLGER